MKKYIISACLMLTCSFSLLATSPREQAEEIYNNMKIHERERTIQAIQHHLEQQERERRDRLIKIPFQIGWFVIKNSSKLCWYLTRCTGKFIYDFIVDREDLKWHLQMGNTQEWIGLVGALGLSTALGYYLKYKIISSYA